MFNNPSPPGWTTQPPKSWCQVRNWIDVPNPSLGVIFFAVHLSWGPKKMAWFMGNHGEPWWLPHHQMIVVWFISWGELWEDWGFISLLGHHRMNVGVSFLVNLRKIVRMIFHNHVGWLFWASMVTMVGGSSMRSSHCFGGFHVSSEFH